MLKQIISFLPWYAKASLEIEIPDDTEECFRLKIAVEIAVKQGKSLDGARLVGARLDSIRTDVFDFLLRGIPELPGLLAALREGRIDGSVYSGECACFVGTIANVRGVDVEDSQFDFRNSSRPAECWFMGINKGDTPETNQISKITEGWIVEFMTLVGATQAAE